MVLNDMEVAVRKECCLGRVLQVLSVDHTLGRLSGRSSGLSFTWKAV